MQEMTRILALIALISATLSGTAAMAVDLSRALELMRDRKSVV